MTQTIKAPRIVLTGAGHYFPETIIDNHFFAELDIGSEASWIYDRIGIAERRSILTKEELKSLRYGKITRDELLKAGRIMTQAEMAKPAWNILLERSGLGKRGVKVDTVMAGSSIPDWDIPANACSIAAAIGLPNATSFDANSACSSFVLDLHVMRGLMTINAVQAGAIFNIDRYTTRVDYADRQQCILFGDSAAAMIVERDSKAFGLELLDTFIESEPGGYDLVKMPDGEVFTQNGKAVQKFAITRTIGSIETILERNQLTTKDLTYFIGHQANKRMLDYAAEKLGLSKEQHLSNVETKGNQGGSGAPTVLSENWERFKPGDLIGLSVVGAGLTWGAALFRCVGPK